MSRVRCYACGNRYDEDETALIQARVGGDYRRAARRAKVRVCRECTEAQVAVAVDQQARGLASPVNRRMAWDQAARALGIRIPPGTLIDRMSDRREPTPEAESKR